jgi:hypothetical protein
MSEGARANVELAIKALALLVAAFGIYQYFADRQVARDLAARGAALQYVANYDSVELRSHRQKLSEFWIRNADALLWIQKNGSSEGDYQSFLLSAFENDKYSRDLLTSVYSLTNFYEQVSLCQTTEVCDADVITKHFCSSAKDFQQRYDAIFVQIAAISGTPDFGNGVRQTGRRC